MTHIVETRGLSRRFGNHQAVQQLGLQVPTGSLFGLLGPNGAGKSTTLNMLLGILPPSAGEVLLFGRPWERAALARVGAMINGPKFYGHLTVQENLHLHSMLLDLPATAIAAVVEETELGQALHKRAGHLSTGMKTRLGLATALLGSPDLLVLDEPQNGLDPEGIRELRALLRQQVQKGKTVLLSSHLLSEVAQLVDHVAVIRDGQLRYQGPLQDLVRPGDDLEKVYFDLVSQKTQEVH